MKFPEVDLTYVFEIQRNNGEQGAAVLAIAAPKKYSFLNVGGIQKLKRENWFKRKRCKVLKIQLSVFPGSSSGEGV